MDNKFIYLCFFILSFGVCYVFEKILIPTLTKKAEQPIYTEGPSWHSKKRGTPTMGGLAFLISSLFCLVLSFLFLDFNKELHSIIVTLVFAIINSLIGVFDDFTKLKRKKNAGLTPFEKLFLQLLCGVLFLMARAYYLEDEPILAFSFGSIKLGLLYYPFALLIILGIINCANLTDGIDGLACSVATVIGIMFFVIYSDKSLSCGIISTFLIGMTSAFLFFNINPAKIFMGDTGSLFLGAMTVGLCFSVNNPFLSLIFGIVYVIEGASVILQVLSYKLTKKRIFKMAPLHHHLEKCRFNENKICLIAVIFTAVISSLVIWM